MIEHLGHRVDYEKVKKGYETNKKDKHFEKAYGFFSSVKSGKFHHLPMSSAQMDYFIALSRRYPANNEGTLINFEGKKGPSLEDRIIELEKKVSFLQEAVRPKPKIPKGETLSVRDICKSPYGCGVHPKIITEGLKRLNHPFMEIAKDGKEQPVAKGLWEALNVFWEECRVAGDGSESNASWIFKNALIRSAETFQCKKHVRNPYAEKLIENSGIENYIRSLEKLRNPSGHIEDDGIDKCFEGGEANDHCFKARDANV